ncbi:hypothetical protein D3C80_1940890 [compost metagenome]
MPLFEFQLNHGLTVLDTSVVDQDIHPQSLLFQSGKGVFYRLFIGDVKCHTVRLVTFVA